MALGIGQLGWSPEVFWSSTLPELLIALRGHWEKEKSEYWRTGTLVSAILNVNRDLKKYGQLTAPDIFPFLLTPQERIDREWQKINAQLIDEDDS